MSVTHAAPGTGRAGSTAIQDDAVGPGLPVSPGMCSGGGEGQKAPSILAVHVLTVAKGSAMPNKTAPPPSRHAPPRASRRRTWRVLPFLCVCLYLWATSEPSYTRSLREMHLRLFFPLAAETVGRSEGRVAPSVHGDSDRILAIF